MNATELQNELNRLGVTPPSVLRASLYLGELQATYDYFKTGLTSMLGSNYGLVKTAVQNPELLNTLAKVLDHYVAQAVQADLASARVAGARPQSFSDYYDQFVFTGVFSTNVNTFYGFFPVTAHMVQQAATNFRSNIRQACTRTISDWEVIEKTFLPATQKLAGLTRIKSSGSDFHKGGQQVLLLTFEKLVYVMDSDDGHLQSFDFNLVYKPSDLEADCLLAGNSATVNAVHRNFQQQSLFEFLNGLVTAKKLTTPLLQLEQLPTYKILPMVYGSTLTAAASGKLPIRTCYGYLEFLKHDHYDGLLSALGLYLGGHSDFKIFYSSDKDAICRKFYRIIGQLTAVACTFSIIDLHVENLIVKDYLPHAIDMEISLTEEITDVDNTSLFTSNGKGGVNGLLGGNKITWNEAVTSGQLRIDDASNSDFEQNRLWMVKASQPIDPADYAGYTCSGMRDMLSLMGDAHTAHKFDSWLARMTNVVVRYLPLGTLDFTSILNSMVNRSNCRNANKIQEIIAYWMSVLYDRWTNDTSGSRVPNFAALQNAFVRNDYANGDIPIFYHRISTSPPAGLNIMDSDGNQVTIPVQVDTLDQSNQIQAQNVAVGRTTFFSQSPITGRVRPQIDELTNHLGARTQTLVGQVLQKLGLAHGANDIQNILR